MIILHDILKGDRRRGNMKDYVGRSMQKLLVGAQGRPEWLAGLSATASIGLSPLSLL